MSVSAKQAQDAKKELPVDWRWVQLGEVTTIVNGTTPESENPFFWNGNIVWITPTDLGKLAEPFIRNSDRKITKAGFDSRNLTRVPPRTIVLSSRAPIGHLGIAAVELCTNQGCKSFIPNDDVDEWFLYYALKRSVWKLQQLGSGATFAEISKTQLERFEIPLPPLPEQRRIAGALREQMAAVEKARTAAQARLEAVKSLPAAYLRQVFPQPDQPLPDGWRLVKLGEVCEIVSGQVDPKESRYRDLPHVNGENIESGTGRLMVIRSAAEDRMTSGKYLFEAGVVLYSKLRPYLKKAVIADFRGLCSADIYPIFPMPDELILSFLLQILLSEPFTTYAESESQRSRMPKLNRDQLLAYSVPLPPLQEQQRIAGLLREQLVTVEKARAAAEAELSTINALPAALLRRVFSGEL